MKVFYQIFFGKNRRYVSHFQNTRLTNLTMVIELELYEILGEYTPQYLKIA